MRYIIIGWTKKTSTEPRRVVYFDGYDWCDNVSEARIYVNTEEFPKREWLHTSEIDRVFKMKVSFGAVEEV